MIAPFPSIRRHMRLLMPLGLLIALLVAAVRTGTAGSPPNVAILAGDQLPPFQDVIKGLKQHLQEKQPAVHLDIVFMAQDAAGVNRLTEQIADGKVDAVVTLGSQPLEKMLATSRTLPIIGTMIMRPDRDKTAENLGGVMLDLPLRSQFDWLRRFLPEAKKIGVLYNPAENDDYVKKAAETASAAGLELVPIEVSQPQELPAALQRVTRGTQVLWGVSDTMVLSPRTAKNILLATFQERIPFIGLSDAWVKAGALYALERDYVDIGRQCGELLEKALAGTPMRSVGWVHPRRVLYVLNRNTAEHMKLTLPEELIRGAVTVY